MNITSKTKSQNKLYFSAGGSILLPSALKWGLFILLSMIILPFLSGKSVFAANAVLTLTIPKDALLLEVSATDTTTKESNSANITVSSTAYWGYTFSIKSDSEDGALTSGEKNKLPAATAEKATLDDNTWGFKVSGDRISNNNFRNTNSTGR